MRARGFVVGAAVVVTGFLLRGPVDSRDVPVREDGKPIRVEVLNGSGVNRAGQGLAEELRELGFDVVDVRNADRADYEETLVLDRVGVFEYAWAVAEHLEVAEPLQQRNGDLLLEVTVILGRDRGARYGEGR